MVFVTVVEGISRLRGARRGRPPGPPRASSCKFPYHPHVTIAHHLEDPVLDRAFEELATFECLFEALEFHLYHHSEGDGWVPTRAFKLTGPA